MLQSNKRKALGINCLTINEKYNNSKCIGTDPNNKHYDDLWKKWLLPSNNHIFVGNGDYITDMEHESRQKFDELFRKGYNKKDIVMFLLSPYFTFRTLTLNKMIQLSNTKIQHCIGVKEMKNFADRDESTSKNVCLYILWNKRCNWRIFDCKSNINVLSSLNSFYISKFFLDQLEEFNCGQVIMKNNMFDTRANIYQIPVLPDEVDTCIQNQCLLKGWIRFFSSSDKPFFIQFIGLRKTEQNNGSGHSNPPMNTEDFKYKDNDFGYEHFFNWSPLYTDL